MYTDDCIRFQRILNIQTRKQALPSNLPQPGKRSGDPQRQRTDYFSPTASMLSIYPVREGNKTEERNSNEQKDQKENNDNSKRPKSMHATSTLPSQDIF